MINNKNFFHVDDQVLNLFCPNSNQLVSKEKYIAFKKQLSSFHNIEEIYKGSYTNYLMYISKSVLSNALEENKNILSYEHYFYDVCAGYIKKNKLRISPKNIATAWVTLVNVFNSLLTLSSNSKNTQIFQDIYLPVKHLNSSVPPSSYFITIPILNITITDKVEPVLFIPYYNTNIYSNLMVLSTIKYYESVIDTLHVLLFDMDNGRLRYESLSITDYIKSNTTKLLDKLVIDFTKSNISNCIVCPIKNCNTNYVFHNIRPLKYNQVIRDIKLLEIK